MTPLISPALVEKKCKTQANVNGLNFICQETRVTPYNTFQVLIQLFNFIRCLYKRSGKANLGRPGCQKERMT